MTSVVEKLAASRTARTTVAYAAAAWLVIQVVATVSEPLGWPRSALRLSIVVLVCGFFIAVPMALWFDRRANRTGLLPADTAASDAPRWSVTPPINTSPDVSVLTIAPPEAASVAVLAFADMSAAKDQDYFCEGAAEEIINALNHVRGLRVAARAASFQFKHRFVDSREIGRLLNVRAVLDGSVRKAGDRVRIAAQLVDTQNGTHLWSQTFDRKLEDIFAIQEEIARSTVQALRVTLLAADGSRLHDVHATANVAAYEQYLRARQLARKETNADQLAAAERYRQALRLDPEFALAHAALAALIAHLVFRNEDLRPSLAPEAQRAIDRAVDLAPDSAATHVARGQVHSMLKRYDDAERAFLRAIELDPCLFDAHYYFARFCASQGKHAQAAAHYAKASALQPDEFLPIVLSIQEYVGANDRAGEQRAIELSSVAIERRLAIDPDDTAALGHGIGVMALLGRNAESKEYAERAIALRPHEGSVYYTAACGAALGHDYDQALEWLEKAVDYGFRNADWIANDPDMNPLRQHPRYQRLLERLA